MPDTQEKQFSKQDIPHRVNRIKIVLVLSSSYLAAAILIVIFTGSLALLSEAGHMLADVGGLVLALIAINYTRKPATSQRTYGFYRMEILASLVNSVVLVLLSVYILYEGFRRIFEPPEIQSFPIIVVAAVGLTMNFIGMRLLSGGGEGERHFHASNGHKDEVEKEEQEESLNVKAVYLETLSDTLGAAGV